MTTPTFNKEHLFACLIVDNIQVSEDTLQKALDDDSSGFYAIGRLYEFKEKYDKAMGWYHLGAAKGHADSHFRIGLMYNEGEGVSVNYKLAMDWYLKAFDHGSAMAANNIGSLYSFGHGVNQDYKIALMWVLRAADRGISCAQYNIGLAYENGCDVKIDKQYALEWYEKSAEQGFEDAKAKIELLNNQGFYIDIRQRRYLQIEKDLEAQKSKNESLEIQQSVLKQKLLASENEIKLLKQENEVLKLKSHRDTRDQEDIIQQLVERLSKMTHQSDTPSGSSRYY